MADACVLRWPPLPGDPWQKPHERLDEGLSAELCYISQTLLHGHYCQQAMVNKVSIVPAAEEVRCAQLPRLPPPRAATLPLLPLTMGYKPYRRRHLRMAATCCSHALQGQEQDQEHRGFWASS